MVIVFLIFWLMLLIPGFLLYKVIMPDDERDIAEVTGISAMLGFAVCAVTGLAMYLLTAKLNSLIYCVGLSSLLFFITLLFKKYYLNKSLLIKPKIDGSQRFYLGMLLAVILIVTALSFIMGGNIYGIDMQDSYYFISCISNIANKNIATGFDPYFYSQKILNPYYLYNPLFIIFAFLSNSAEISAFNLWMLLPGIIMPLSVLAIYTLSKVITENTRAAFFVTLLSCIIDFFYVTDYSWYGISKWQAIAYPNKMCFSVVILFLISNSLRFIKGGNLKELLICQLIIILMVLVYPGSAPIYGVTLFVFALFYLINKSNLINRRLFIQRVACLVAGLGIIVTGVVLLRHFQLAGLYTADIGNIDASTALDEYKKDFVIWNRFFFALQPKVLFDDWLRIAAIPLICIVYSKRKTIGTLYLFAATIGITLLLVVPFFTGPLGNILPWLFTIRFKFQIPSILVTAYVIFLVLENKFEIKLKTIALVLAFFLAAFGLFRSINGKRSGVVFTESVQNFLNKNIEPGTMILADEYSSYSLPMFADVDIFITLKGVNRLILEDGEQRYKQIKEIRNGNADVEQIKDLAKKYNADYIFVAKHFWSDNGERFLSESNTMDLIYSEEGYLIYKINE